MFSLKSMYSSKTITLWYFVCFNWTGRFVCLLIFNIINLFRGERKGNPMFLKEIHMRTKFWLQLKINNVYKRWYNFESCNSENWMMHTYINNRSRSSNVAVCTTNCDLKLYNIFQINFMQQILLQIFFFFEFILPSHHLLCRPININNKVDSANEKVFS